MRQSTTHQVASQFTVRLFLSLFIKYISNMAQSSHVVNDNKWKYITECTSTQKGTKGKTGKESASVQVPPGVDSLNRVWSLNDSAFNFNI